jgi:flagellar protein FlaG
MDIGKVSQGRQPNLELVSNSDTVSLSGQNTLQESTKTVDFKVNAVRETTDEKPQKEELQKAVDKLNELLKGEQTHVVYEVHDKLNDIMIKVVDEKTKEVILEVPPKKILDMVSKMMEKAGLLMDKKA